ncbi:MAG TPA: tetraacyldisaccharide 4'-kinase [Methylomirabilota bacterium]
MAEAARSPELWLHEAWHGRASPVVRAGLSVASAAYRAALAARSASYRIGVLSTRTLPVPVISVGNVTVGGSGKTPLTEVVALALADMGARPAVISRGYGRRSRGVRIVADGGGILLGARDGGDEPVLLAEHLPGVPVVVGESRYEAAAVAVASCGAGALVIDDGFQHRTLAKDLEILAISGREPWGNGRLFPRGSLREPLSALKRAGVVVVTNPATVATTNDVAHVLRRKGSRATVLSGAYHPTALRRGDRGHSEAAGTLTGRRVLALAGLAAPGGFVATAESLGAEVAGVAAFPDHYWYTAGDLARVAASARELGAEAVLTTEKDWIRIREILRGDGPQDAVPFWVLPVRLDMGSDRGALLQALAETLKRVAVGRRVT